MADDLMKSVSEELQNKNPLEISMRGYQACLDLNKCFHEALSTLKTPIANPKTSHMHSSHNPNLFPIKLEKFSSLLTQVQYNLAVMRCCKQILDASLPFSKEDAQDFLLGEKEVSPVTLHLDIGDESESSIQMLRKEVESRDEELRFLQSKLMLMLASNQMPNS